jgi:hypothetical protein
MLKVYTAQTKRSMHAQTREAQRLKEVAVGKQAIERMLITTWLKA